MTKSRANRLRIIGGEWRSRLLPFPDVQGLRPTTDRVRETLFNWIQQDIVGARCLDLFSGSGALGFEALSRGAASVVLTEKNGKAALQLTENAELLKAKNAEIYQAEALYWLDHWSVESSAAFDLIFLDPPFGQDLLQDCIDRIDRQGLLKPNAWVYIESELALADMRLPSSWRLHREKRTGQVMSRLFRSE